MSVNNMSVTSIPSAKGNDDEALAKQRPLSSSFNELSGGTTTARKDHELHYLKNYTSLTEYELIILRKTAFTNLRNQFRSLNGQGVMSGSANVLNLSSEHISTNNLLSPVNKNSDDNVTPASAIGNHVLASQSTISSSLSALNHNHNHNSTPGKDLRESIIKTLENISKGRTSKKWKIFTKKDKKRAVFGVPLVTSLEYAFVYIDPSEKCSNKKIPIVVYECINFLRNNGLKKEGIFRVNGSERRINNSLKVFNETAGYGFGYDFEGMNVFDVASLLKLYIRQLPEPLIPYCLYSSFLDVIKYIPETLEKVKAFQYLFMMLPSSHLILLEILLQFLSEITSYYEDNHMNAHNLACIFAPNLLRSKESTSTSNLLTLSSSDEYEVALQAVEFLINHKSCFCITSPEVKPFQLFNKFDKDVILNTNMEGTTSISVSDFTALQKSSLMAKVAATNSMNQKNNSNDNGNRTSCLKNEIKIESKSDLGSSKSSINEIKIENKSDLGSSKSSVNEIKIENKSDLGSSKSSINSPTESTNNLQPYNPISLSTSNMKSDDSDVNIGNTIECAKSMNNIKTQSEEEFVKDADINNKAHHPVVDPIDISGSHESTNSSPTSNSNPTTPFNITSIKCKSNLENVRTHPDEPYYTINTCPLVSTSLNRLNYLPIKNEEFYEYLARDDDNITSTVASEKAATPIVDKFKDNVMCDSPITKESISVSSFNKTEEIENNTSNPLLGKKTDIDNGNNDQPYPSNVLNLAQKNRENSVSFLSPLSTPSQPIFSIPPPPTTPPVV